MKGIKLYVEGGGDSSHQKREMRIGLNALLASEKTAAQRKRLTWDSVFRGGRQQTFDAFRYALQQADQETLLVLLVDSEAPVTPETKGSEANAEARVQHLVTREKDWDFAGADPHQVHLMVQCMEAWIVADPEALADFYGKNFHAKSLPNRQNLEEESKLDVLAKLQKATEKTQKGKYAKIKHASKLLERIAPAKIAKRCSRFSTLTTWLAEQIEKA